MLPVSQSVPSVPPTSIASLINQAKDATQDLNAKATLTALQTLAQPIASRGPRRPGGALLLQTATVAPDDLIIIRHYDELKKYFDSRSHSPFTAPPIDVEVIQAADIGTGKRYGFWMTLGLKLLRALGLVNFMTRREALTAAVRMLEGRIPELWTQGRNSLSVSDNIEQIKQWLTSSNPLEQAVGLLSLPHLKKQIEGIPHQQPKQSPARQNAAQGLVTDASTSLALAIRANTPEEARSHLERAKSQLSPVSALHQPDARTQPSVSPALSNTGATAARQAAERSRAEEQQAQFTQWQGAATTIQEDVQRVLTDAHAFRATALQPIGIVPGSTSEIDGWAGRMTNQQLLLSQLTTKSNELAAFLSRDTPNVNEARAVTDSLKTLKAALDTEIASFRQLDAELRSHHYAAMNLLQELQEKQRLQERVSRLVHPITTQLALLQERISTCDALEDHELRQLQHDVGRFQQSIEETTNTARRDSLALQQGVESGLASVQNSVTSLLSAVQEKLTLRIQGLDDQLTQLLQEIQSSNIIAQATRLRERLTDLKQKATILGQYSLTKLLAEPTPLGTRLNHATDALEQNIREAAHSAARAAPASSSVEGPSSTESPSRLEIVTFDREVDQITAALQKVSQGALERASLDDLQGTWISTINTLGRSLEAATVSARGLGAAQQEKIASLEALFEEKYKLITHAIASQELSTEWRQINNRLRVIYQEAHSLPIAAATSFKGTALEVFQKGLDQLARGREILRRFLDRCAASGLNQSPAYRSAATLDEDFKQLQPAVAYKTLDKLQALFPQIEKNSSSRKKNDLERAKISLQQALETLRGILDILPRDPRAAALLQRARRLSGDLERLRPQ